MDTLISDLNPQAGISSAARLIGWWCLFDAEDVWEWGRALMTDVYGYSACSRLVPPRAYLEESAND